MILRYVLSVIFFNSLAYTQIRQRVSVYPIIKKMKLIIHT